MMKANYSDEDERFYSRLSRGARELVDRLEAVMDAAGGPGERAAAAALEERELLERLPREMGPLGTAAPLRFRLLGAAAMPAASRRLVLQRLDAAQAPARAGSSESGKVLDWCRAVAALPFGVVAPLPAAAGASAFLRDARARLDAEVLGLPRAKDALLRVVGRWLAGGGRGAALALQGPPGCGKTSLATAIAGALGLPSAVVSLAGATDSSVLLGHSFTYEGSRQGAVAAHIARAGCINPVIVLDELDKTSDTAHGTELANVLVALTDPAQNAEIVDRYLEVPLDLSRALLVFSFNDASCVNPVLMDRLSVVNVPGYCAAQKLDIARELLAPRALRDHGLEGVMAFDEGALRALVAREAQPVSGVRALQRRLAGVVGELNLQVLRGERQRPAPGEPPFVVDERVLAELPPDALDDGNLDAEGNEPPAGMYL